MTFNEILRAVAERDDCKVQLVHECMSSSQAMKGKKGRQSYTRLTIETTEFTPNDMMYYTFDRPGTRTPKHVGIIVWVPFEEYNRMTA